MTEQQIDRLVAHILQRLQPPVLVMVTAAEGYRHEICQRLARCGERLHLALEGMLPDSERWASLGETLPAESWQRALPPAPYKALLLPFLDYPLAMDLLNGTLHSPVAQRVHDALCAGIPVLALRYLCDPHSELNALRGEADSAYAAHLGTTLTRLAECGIMLGSLNDLLARLEAGAKAPTVTDGTRRYLTVTDIVNNPALADSPDAVLTDAAVDFLKTQRKITLPR
ncbi:MULTISPECIES: hypothetical protein [Enterobacteriaceae]|uniref:hypothetical protein n=1 Tax=Enterobacteriaceae TaxID=543 RepID=UPI0015DCAE8B|nr:MULTISPECIES: hypothetical protein [unclassified Klebsiella]HAT3955035.1 hypothetical protein [Kluyvera ascorbata]BBR58343.1 hypothetical protein WP4W18E05_17110 [Klebsiella sp. WP4-W18-ESBL-05]BBS92365.1 hypothetical protein WP7S18C02_29800 [Klebsiella sp. WP7-S18-CRE-02]BBS97395.1 hypothetical protein WP7S18C03_29880 [Klebsiella sp. WP7-S18-CRE-03]BBT02462.1 hypothetical protein WP7S18E04_30240 [Klebsiella sp. WP7-S18-ESBL-04]